jgi:hypothetical protein
MSDLADEYRAFEAEADELLGQVGDDTDTRSLALVRRFRTLARQHGKAIESALAAGRKQAIAELAQQRQTEAAFRRLNVPETARTLFAGVDPTDQAAMATRAEELRQAGVTWPGQPAPEPPPDPHRFLAEQAAMQQAEAGGSAPDQSLEHRMERMAQHPESFSDQQISGAIDELNAQVRAAAAGPSSGALG